MSSLTRSAAELARDIDFRGQGRRWLRDDQTPRQFVELLDQEEQHGDAIRFLAHALPKRLAVWWGCLCLWQAYRPEPSPAAASVLETALRWVREPSEAHRRAAEAPGRAAGLDSPAGCLGLAVFWSGGSMSKPEWPAVPPPPLLTAKTVAGAVLLAAAQSGLAPMRAQRRREFVALGLQTAAGEGLWVERPVAAALERVEAIEAVEWSGVLS